MDIAFDWLLHSEPWIEYRTRLDLLGESEHNLSVASAKEKTLKDEKIRAYLSDITSFHNQLVTTHKNPVLPLHKLTFLLEIGLDMKVPEINSAIQDILEHKDNFGVYQSVLNIPKHFGGSGENTFGWCLCDAPILLYCLAKAGLSYNEHIKNGVDYLAVLLESYGFPCSASYELGKFRGPGRKDDPCPYATLQMLKLFALLPQYQNSESARTAAYSLLELWENSMDRPIAAK